MSVLISMRSGPLTYDSDPRFVVKDRIDHVRVRPRILRADTPPPQLAGDGGIRERAPQRRAEGPGISVDVPRLEMRRPLRDVRERAPVPDEQILSVAHAPRGLGAGRSAGQNEGTRVRDAYTGRHIHITQITRITGAATVSMYIRRTSLSSFDQTEGKA